MEGMKVLTSDFEKLVVPVTMLLLVALFLAQRFGSGKIGGAFGPIMFLQSSSRLATKYSKRTKNGGGRKLSRTTSLTIWVRIRCTL
jgi:KUP system potassium uptake protein